MRYYLMGDGQEKVLDLVKTEKLKPDLVKFHFEIRRSPEPLQSWTVYIRKLAGKFFYSLEGVVWNRLCQTGFSSHLVSVNQLMDVYRGYRPSGLTSSEEGVLHTKMPGKVVKILVQEGEEVDKGQTLLILEAMKMENEIKSHYKGKVKHIHVKEGQALEQGILLMELDHI